MTYSGVIADTSVSWVSYTGVDQTTPTEAFNGNSGVNAGSATDATVVVTSVTDNCWMHYAMASSQTSGMASSNTSRNIVTGAGGTGADADSNGVVHPAGAQTGRYTGNGITSAWAMAGYAIRPVQAAASYFDGWQATSGDMPRRRPQKTIDNSDIYQPGQTVASTPASGWEAPAIPTARRRPTDAGSIDLPLTPATPLVAGWESSFPWTAKKRPTSPGTADVPQNPAVAAPAGFDVPDASQARKRIRTTEVPEVFPVPPVVTLSPMGWESVDTSRPRRRFQPAIHIETIVAPVILLGGGTPIFRSGILRSKIIGQGWIV